MKNEHKRGINKKVLLGITSLLACVGIIIVSSFFPFLIDPSKFLTTEFLTNELIIVAIVIFSTISVMFIGQASNSANPESKIAKARVKFSESVKRITNVNTFFQWVRRVQQPNDIKQIKEREVRKLGIDDVNVLALEISQIQALVEHPQEYEGKYYKSLTKEQAQAIISIKTKFKITLVEPSYYLTCKSIDADKTITEKSGNEGKKKAGIVSISIISKLVMTIIIAMVFSSIIPDQNSKTEMVKAWSLFASRMMAVLSSSFMGFMVGSQINDIDADYIEMRVTVHQQFVDDKDFKPLTQQEEAKEQYEKDKTINIGEQENERREEQN